MGGRHLLNISGDIRMSNDEREQLEQYATGMYNTSYSDLQVLVMAQAKIAQQIAEELKK
jgi:hypothetical protein